MQGNGKIQQWTLIRAGTKISRNKSWRYGNPIMESRNENRTIHNNKLETIICYFEKGTCMLIDAAI